MFDWKMISSDSHVVEPPNLWTERMDRAFRDRGIPYLYLGVEDHEDYHAPGDTVDKIETSFFLQVAELTRDLAETLDRAPGRILP